MKLEDKLLIGMSVFAGVVIIIAGLSHLFNMFNWMIGLLLFLVIFFWMMCVFGYMIGGLHAQVSEL